MTARPGEQITQEVIADLRALIAERDALKVASPAIVDNDLDPNFSTLHLRIAAGRKALAEEGTRT